MFRVPLVLATLLEVAQSACPDCNFDLTKLEEFSVDYHSVQIEHTDFYTSGTGAATMTTGALPETFPSEHGTLAVHVRNLQFKVDSHVSFPTPFAIGAIPLSGMQLHEELHLNGATGQASFHMASPIVNMCFQLDGLPPFAQMEHANIESHLQRAERISTEDAPRVFRHVTLDGDEDMGPSPHLLFTTSSHPAFLQMPPDPTSNRIMRMFNPPPSMTLMMTLAAKFDNYVNSVGDQFVIRACEIADHSRSQSLLATSPDAQEFVVNRIAQHQRRLQAVLHPGLNTTFGAMELKISDLLVPSAQPCTTDFAQMPGTDFSSLQAVAFAVSSFVTGVAATFAVFRRTRTSSADDYHQVA